MSAAKKKSKARSNTDERPVREPAKTPRAYWGASVHEWCIAAGLGILIYWRPWQDGIVIPDSNGTYLLGTMLLFVLWAGRGLARGTAHIALTPFVLLIGFLAAAWATGFASVEYGSTQVALTVWSGYVMLFLLASSLRSGVVIGFLVAFIVMASASEALFSIIHLKYSLPETRVFVRSDPQAAAQLFGYELNAALVHRLNSNRAFGTLLFANGLATWLVATIPLALFGAWHAIQQFRSGANVGSVMPPLVRGVIIGIVAAVASTPVLSGAQTISALANVAFSNVVVGLPISRTLMLVPVAEMMTVLAQLVAVALAFGIYAVLSMLIKNSEERGEEFAAPALIAGVFSAGVLCIGLAVLYSRFHFFYFAESVMVGDRLQFARAPMWQPFIPFLFFVLVVPIVGAGIAIRITRSRGPAAFAWLALAVVLTVAALSQSVALWMTYSRGGMLALLVGMVVTMILFRPGRPAPNTIARLISTAAVVLFVIVATALLIGDNAYAQDPTAETPINPFVEEIQVDGADMTLGDLVNPTTVALRFSYWSGAFRMAADHWLTGVGLGNFGVEYPQYQPLGGGDSKQVHNDFLQLLCETGVVGLLFFAGFWVWFVVAGAQRLRTASVADGGWWLGGLYACVVGFLVHASVDFPFVDPTLASLVYLVAGLFWAKAREGATESNASPTRARALMTVCLLMAFAVFGLQARAAHVDAAVGTKQVRQQRISFASQLVRGFETPDDAPPSVSDRAMALLIEDPSMRAAFGTHFYRQPPGSPNYTQLPPGSPIPRDAVLVLTNMPLAMSKAREASANWTTRIAEADAVFPYDPDIAHHLSVWFDMLWRNSDSPTAGIDYIKQAVEWAEKAVERSPGQIAYYDWLCSMRWRQALSEPELEDQLAYYNRSLEAIDRTVELYPIKPHLWDRRALLYLYATDKFTERGEEARARECEAIMKESQVEAASIRKQLLAFEK